MNVNERFELIDEAFSPSAPIHNAELLAGRQDQLFQLQDMSRTVGAHAAIYGERGVGKTSLASVFAQDLRARRVAAPTINCATMDGFERLWSEMFDEWRDEAQLGSDDAEALRLASLGVTQQVVVRTLARLLDARPVVFVFDEFDSLANDGGVSSEMANVMKALSDRRLDAHIVVVGIAEDIEMLMNGHQSVARGLREVNLPRLSRSEMEAILGRGFDTVEMTIPAGLVERVVDLSYGLPHYAHAYGRQLAVQAAKAEVDHVDESHWPEALAAVLRDAEQQIFGFYSDALTTSTDPLVPIVVHACAVADPDGLGYFTADLVWRAIEQGPGKPSVDDVTGTLEILCSSLGQPALEAKDLSNGTRQYRFTNPLMRPYVLAKAIHIGGSGGDGRHGESN